MPTCMCVCVCGHFGLHFYMCVPTCISLSLRVCVVYVCEIMCACRLWVCICMWCTYIHLVYKHFTILPSLSGASVSIQCGVVLQNFWYTSLLTEEEYSVKEYGLTLAFKHWKPDLAILTTYTWQSFLTSNLSPGFHWITHRTQPKSFKHLPYHPDLNKNQPTNHAGIKQKIPLRVCQCIHRNGILQCIFYPKVRRG